VVLLALAGFGLAMLVNGGERDTGGESRPESSSQVDSGDNDAGSGSGAQPGNTPGPGKPGQPGEFVEVDEKKYLGRPAAYASESLARLGLIPVVEAQDGEEPDDPDNCTVIEIDADGPLRVGTEVPIFCKEEQGPSR